MNNDKICQLIRACDEKELSAMMAVLNCLDNSHAHLDTLLSLTADNLIKGNTEKSLLLFNKVLSIKIPLAEKLQQLFENELQDCDLAAKELLLNETVKAQTDYGQLLALGLLYRDCELFVLAEQLFLHLIEKSPEDIRAFHRLISVYIRMQRFHEAIACCQLALEINPSSLTAHYNLGVANQSVNRDEEALSNFARALDIDPDNQWAQINISHVLLKQGYFDEGWKRFEWRKAFYEKKSNDLASVYCEWSGQSLQGKSILLWADQGLGDIIMYSGLIDKVCRLGCNVLIMAESRMRGLFERSFPIQHFFTDSISAEQQQTIPIDYQLPISGLGARFIHHFSDFSTSGKYLKADTVRSRQFFELMKNKYRGKKIVGFSWKGGGLDTKKYSRNISLSLWKPLLSRSDCQFINLQYNCTLDECSMIDDMGGITPEIDLRQDIDGVAALLNAVDLFISVDNSTIHLAGALGVPVWAFLPYSSDWRWFSDTKNSHWYPSMHLIRQQSIGQWKDCLSLADEALSEFSIQD